MTYVRIFFEFSKVNNNKMRWRACKKKSSLPTEVQPIVERHAEGKKHKDVVVPIKEFFGKNSQLQEAFILDQAETQIQVEKGKK